MDSSKIKNVVNQQRKFFQTGATLPVKFRIEALKNLRQTF